MLAQPDDCVQESSPTHFSTRRLQRASALSCLPLDYRVQLSNQILHGASVDRQTLYPAYEDELTNTAFTSQVSACIFSVCSTSGILSPAQQSCYLRCTSDLSNMGPQQCSCEMSSSTHVSRHTGSLLRSCSVSMVPCRSSPASHLLSRIPQILLLQHTGRRLPDSKDLSTPQFLTLL